MTEDTPEAQVLPQNQPEVERRKIEKLVEKYRESLGGFDLVQVGDSGFLLQSERLRPMAGGDWVLFDYDDTLVATTEVKQARLDLFTKHLEQKLGYSVSREVTSKVMEVSDRLSRWEEKQGEGEQYHAGAHMSALTWAVDVLSKTSPEDLDNTLNDIGNSFTRIRSQLDEGGESGSGDPFYFKDRKLILRSKRPWSKDIEEIFLQTAINPPVYEESVTAAKEAGEPVWSIHRINVGVFTYGEPYYQLLKVFELLNEHKSLPISQVWLTRRPKGEFIEALVKTSAVRKTELQYVPPELEEYPGESLAYPSGYPLGETPHTMVMFDDNPNELQNILKSNEFLKEKSGATFVAVRSRRPGTKAEKREWTVISPYGEIDFTSRTYSGKEVSKIFKINRFLMMRGSLGAEHPRVKRAIQELEGIGVDTKRLKEF